MNNTSDVNLVPIEMNVSDMQIGQWGYVVPWIFVMHPLPDELNYYSVSPEPKGSRTAKLEKTETGFKKRFDW